MMQRVDVKYRQRVIHPYRVVDIMGNGGSVVDGGVQPHGVVYHDGIRPCRREDRCQRGVGGDRDIAWIGGDAICPPPENRARLWRRHHYGCRPTLVGSCTQAIGRRHRIDAVGVKYGHKAGVTRNGDGARIGGIAVVPAHEAVAAVGGGVDYRQRIGAGWFYERLHRAHLLISRRCREGKAPIFDEVGEIAPPTIVRPITAAWDIYRYGGCYAIKSTSTQYRSCRT